MSVARLEAVFNCDGCGVAFSMDIDPAKPQREGKSAYDMAEDALRGGHVGRIGPSGHCSFQGGHHLCPKCTSIVDELPQDAPTAAQVAAKLNEAFR